MKKLVVIFAIVYSNSVVFGQEKIDTRTKEDKDLENRIQLIEEELRKQKGVLEATEKNLSQLKKDKNIPSLEKENSGGTYISPMKENGLNAEFMKSMFLDPEHAKEFRDSKKLWVNDILRVGFMLRPRMEARQNLDFNNKTDDYENRALQASQIFFIVDPNPYLSMKVTIQDARVWGGSTAVSSGDRKYYFTNVGSEIIPAQRNSTSVPNSTDVREAFFILKVPNFPVKAILGRQIFAFGDQRIIGGANWNTNGQSFDGGRIVYESKSFDSHIFGSKTTASSNGPNGVLTANGRRNGRLDDSYLIGNYNTLKFSEFLIDLYAFGILKKWIPKTPGYPGEIVADQDVASNNRSRQNDQLITVGTRITNRTAGNFLPSDKNWDWTIESAFQTGLTGERLYASWDLFKDSTNGKSNYSEKNKYTGQLHVFQTGYTFEKKTRIGIQYNYSSGDPNRQDASVSTFQLLPNPRFGIFPYFDSVAGLAENIGLKNLKSYNLNLSYKTNEWGSFILSGFIHRKAVRQDSWYSISGDPKTGAVGSCSVNALVESASTENCNGNSYSNNTYLGSGLYNEVDFAWIYHWNEGVSIWLGGGYLHAGDAIRNVRTDINNPNPLNRYTFNPNAYMSYFMLNVAM